MQVDSIGEVIAVRRLFLVDEPDREILVKMGKPQKTPGEQDFYCSYQIMGLDDEKPNASVGIDSFQAMQLALRSVGEKLILMNRNSGGRLRWECDEQGGFGFPAPPADH